jgi:hypothetical protein
MAEANQAVQEWYANQLKEFFLEQYRSGREGTNTGETHPPSERELGSSATRVNPAALPEPVRQAHEFYKQHFEDADIGWARALQVPAGDRTTYAIRVHTDGDDGYLEVYDDQGGFLAAGRTYLEVVAWGDLDWLRAQAESPGELPPELKDAHQRTVVGKPLPGYCNIACRLCQWTGVQLLLGWDFRRSRDRLEGGWKSTPILHEGVERCLHVPCPLSSKPGKNALKAS